MQNAKNLLAAMGEDEMDPMEKYGAGIEKLAKQFGLDVELEDDDDIKVNQKDVDDVVNNVMAEVRKEEEEKAKKEAEKQKKIEEKQKEETEKKILSHGVKLVTAAIEKDNAGSFVEASVLYDKCIDFMCRSLRFIREGPTREKVIENVVGYMDRLTTLQVAFEAAELSNPDAEENKRLNANRLNAYIGLYNAGFSILQRGVTLRKKAKAAAEKGSNWEALLYYTESTDALVAYMKSDKKGGSSDVVKNAVVDNLNAAETIKASFTKTEE